jgi:hypothetical protein
MELKD